MNPGQQKQSLQSTEQTGGFSNSRERQGGIAVLEGQI